MKLSALIPDELMAQVQKYSQGATKTECVILALQEWVSIKELKKLNVKLKKKPLEFAAGYDAKKIRQINRQQ